MNGRNWLWGMTAAMGLLCAGAAHSAAQERQLLSVAELLAAKNRWRNYSAISLTLSVEGRLGAYSSKLIRLRNCPLRFLPRRDKQFPALPAGTKNVTVTGKLQRRDGQFDFVAQSIQAAPSDEERLRQMQRDLRRDHSAGWYRLAQWALARGEFYQDQKLAESARTLLLTAVEIDRGQLKTEDINGRLLLAEKVRRWKLSGALRQELIHEVYHLKWGAHRRSGRPTLAELLDGLRRDLSGSGSALKAVPAALEKEYARDPLPVYQKSDAQQRRLLHRLLYVAVVREDIERRAKRDGSNGFAIAEQIEKQLPELRPLAEDYRKRELAYRFSRIDRATRNEALALASLFTERKSPQQAAETLRRWLKAQEPRLDGSRPQDWISLADDYLQLVGDKQRAVELLQRAWAQRPDSPQIANRLQRLGYVRYRGQWLRRENVPNVPVSPLDQAIRSGRVVPGMTPQQVRLARASRPTSIIRVASRGKINEVWVFRLPNNSRVTVHFTRDRSAPRSESKVVFVSQLP